MILRKMLVREINGEEIEIDIEATMYCQEEDTDCGQGNQATVEDVYLVNQKDAKYFTGLTDAENEELESMAIQEMREFRRNRRCYMWEDDE